MHGVPTFVTVHVKPGANLNFLVDGFAGQKDRVRRDGIDHCRDIADVLDFNSSKLARLFLAGKEEKDKSDCDKIFHNSTVFFNLSVKVY